jgi:hypothetical protein
MSNPHEGHGTAQGAAGRGCGPPGRPSPRRSDGSCVPRPTHELASCLELGAADANREHDQKTRSGRCAVSL